MIIRTKFEDIKDKSYDVIIIGSGMGGLACAGALSKIGKKVLVLEQHYLIGGMTHTFSRKGFTWDVGVHALGEMDFHRVPGKILRWISNNKIKMNQFGDGPDKVYDTFHFPDISFGLPSGHKILNQNLKAMFPDEAKGIDEYFSLVKYLSKKAKVYFALKILPSPLSEVFNKLFLWRFNKKAWQSTESILNQLFKNQKLKSIISGQWGYYGSEPSKAAFFIQAIVTRHFWNGAFYPEGNSHSIAAAIHDVVKNAGGDFLCNSNVIKISSENNKVLGVELETGLKIFSPVVVSAISAKKSWEKFLPQFKLGLENINKLDVSPCHVCLYIGIEGDLQNTEASQSNQWIYTSWDHEKMIWHPEKLDSMPECLYISFPTLKDPSHRGNKHTVEVVTFVDWKIFETWKDSEIRRRGKEYEEFKKSIENRLLHLVRERFPKLMEKMVFAEVSTPLSTAHYCKTPRGAIYGLAPTPMRFNTKELKPKTPLKNFYLTGGDVATLGVVGALMGGILTSIAVDKKVYRALKSLH
jgi:all-trans-retinol 13,14-reductase